jgi:excisionase family DNA binding protein
VTAQPTVAPSYAGRLLTLDDASAYTTISRTRIERAVKAGHLLAGTPSRDGRRSRLVFRREDLDAWLFAPKAAPALRALPTPVDPRSRQRRRTS